jgi:hypothetical protein
VGAYCCICGRVRPNEAFSGRGRRQAVCGKCQQMPKAERQRIRDVEFLWNVLEQKNISEKNIEYLRAMALWYSDEIGERAATIAELGLVHPRKRKRYGFLIHQKPELYDKLIKLGLIEDMRNTDEFDDDEWLTDSKGAFDEAADDLTPIGDNAHEPVLRDFEDDASIPF